MLNVSIIYNASRKMIFYLNNIRISNWRAYMSISFYGFLLSMTNINHSGQYLINYLIRLRAPKYHLETVPPALKRIIRVKVSDLKLSIPPAIAVRRLLINIIIRARDKKT